jgi:hypothetical protein
MERTLNNLILILKEMGYKNFTFNNVKSNILIKFNITEPISVNNLNKLNTFKVRVEENENEILVIY